MSTHFDVTLRLQVGGCSRVATMTDAAVAALACLTDLRHMDLAGCLDMTDRGEDCDIKPADASNTDVCE